jgi:hypothetical protein
MFVPHRQLLFSIPLLYQDASRRGVTASGTKFSPLYLLGFTGTFLLQGKVRTARLARAASCPLQIYPTTNSHSIFIQIDPD